MNLLRIIASIAFLLLLTYCTNRSTEKSLDRVYTSAELLGKWIYVGAAKLPIDANPKIDFIKLINDTVAEIQIHDSTGARKIYGKWENGFKKEIKPIKPLDIKIKIESDIKISFQLADNHSYILVLRIGEENKKTKMTANNYKFEKE